MPKVTIVAEVACLQKPKPSAQEIADALARFLTTQRVTVPMELADNAFCGSAVFVREAHGVVHVDER